MDSSSTTSQVSCEKTHQSTNPHEPGSQMWYDYEWYGETKNPLCKMCIERVSIYDDIYCTLSCEIQDLGMRGHLASRAPGGANLHSRKAVAALCKR